MPPCLWASTFPLLPLVPLLLLCLFHFFYFADGSYTSAPGEASWILRDRSHCLRDLPGGCRDGSRSAHRRPDDDRRHVVAAAPPRETAIEQRWLPRRAPGCC